MTPPGNTPSQVQDATGGAITVYKAVRKHVVLVAAALLLFIGASLLYARSATPIYESVSMLEIMPHAPQPMGEKSEGVVDMGTGALYWDTRDYYETQYKILSSERVLTAAARDLALANDADFLGGRNKPQTIDEAVAQLRRVVTVDPVKYSRLVQLRVEDKDPQRARRICDAIAAAYI
ncbi:MAG: Wzz/FepE/Etk N-terminal domain-containing protein, partial [Terriglobales bacterium]